MSHDHPAPETPAAPSPATAPTAPDLSKLPAEERCAAAQAEIAEVLRLYNVGLTVQARRTRQIPGGELSMLIDFSIQVEAYP